MSRYVVMAGAGITLAVPTVTAQQDSAARRDSQPSLAEQVEVLDQKVRVLARLLELQRDSLTAAAKQQPKVTAGKEGFVIRSADGDFQLKVRGYVQADGRSYPDGAPVLGTSTLFLRRARPVTEVTAWRYFTLKLVPDFGQGRVVLFDAYLDFRTGPALTFRAGKTKPPIGLERLQLATDIRFIERGLPTNLVPNRDVGLQAVGDFAGGRLSYAVGVFNGVPDLGNLDGDATNDKDLVGRVFLKPTQGLGIGIAASTGNEHGTVTAPSLAAYVTPGQQTMFRYRDSTIANGRRYRVTPQVYFYGGPLGLLGEYVVSSQVVTRGAAVGELKHTSWQVAGSWYVTGEKASFTAVAPRRPFDTSEKHWGALEIGARYGQLTLDDAAFPIFANSTNAVRDVRAWGVGVTWHFVRGTQLSANYEQAQFTGGAPSGADRATEHFFATRFQQAF
ncbi:MAG TPA: porin [Gemmatimonadales bacterium]|nr:porin [Gemmatimonadales bacterium]